MLKRLLNWFLARKDDVLIRVMYRDGASPVSYAHSGDAGFDLRSNEDTIVLEPGERRLVDTGINLEIPPGYEVQIRPRSGLAVKHGITVLNSPGTIDSGYQGPVKVILANIGYNLFVIEKGDRIAQAVPSKVAQAKLVDTRSFSRKTERGAKGFGSSGVK